MTIPERSRDEIDLAQLFRVFRQQWLLTVLVTILATIGAYIFVSQQPKVYEATGSVIASAPEVNSAVTSSGMVSAAQLPQGAVADFIKSRTVLTQVMELVSGSELGQTEKEAVIAGIRRELEMKAFSTLSVRARVDTQQRSIYEIRARAATPDSARVIGEFPKLKRESRNHIVTETTTGELYEPASFLQATLSAIAGQRVLVTDLDVHRPTQHEFWNATGRPWLPLSGSVSTQPSTVVTASQDPSTARVVDFGNGVYSISRGRYGYGYGRGYSRTSSRNET